MKSIKERASLRSLCLLMLATILLSFFVIVTPSFAGSHTVTYFRDNKAGAVSLTFDDGYKTQFQNGLPLLNIRNLKGTFFTITDSNWMAGTGHLNWSELLTIAGYGHEVGSHTRSHSDLTTLDQASVLAELTDSQSAINTNVWVQSCVSLAYPYGNSNPQIQAAASTYYAAARGTWAPEGGILNHYQAGSDMYGTWQQLNFYNTGAYSTSDAMDPADAYFNTVLDVAVLRHAWFPVIFHEITNPTGFGQILDRIMTHNVWIDTYGNISRYMKERLFSQVQVVNDTATEVRLRVVMNAALPVSTYNVPLTLRSTIPASWAQVHVQQGSSNKTVAPVVEGSDTVVYYNAVPNGGDVVLTSGVACNPPAIPMASVNPAVLWPPNHKMVDVTVNYNATDNCSQPTCTISSVTSNEPITSSDYSIVDAHHVKLSADRSGGGNGRIYTATVTCKDAAGLSASQAVMVSVPHDQGK